MVHRPSDSRLLTNLLNAEKEYSKHLLSLLDYSHSSLSSFSAYAAASAPPASNAIIAVAGTLSGADDALRRYVASVDAWRERLRELKDMEDNVGTIMRDREILVARLIKVSKSSKPNRDSIISVEAARSSVSLKSDFNSLPFSLNIGSSKLSIAQAELQACEAQLAAKEKELDERRATAVREGLSIRARAMVECGWVWGEMGKEGLRALEVLGPRPPNEHDLPATLPISTSQVKSLPPRGSSDSSSIAPSQSASNVALPQLVSNGEGLYAGESVEASQSLPHSPSLEIPPAHKIEDDSMPLSRPHTNGVPTRQRLQRRITEVSEGEELGGSSDDDENVGTLSLVQNPRFANEGTVHRRSFSIRGGVGMKSSTSSAAAFPAGTGGPRTEDIHGDKKGFFGSIRGLFRSRDKDRESQNSQDSPVIYENYAEERQSTWVAGGGEKEKKWVTRTDKNLRRAKKGDASSDDEDEHAPTMIRPSLSIARVVQSDVGPSPPSPNGTKLRKKRQRTGKEKTPVPSAPVTPVRREWGESEENRKMGQQSVDRWMNDIGAGKHDGDVKRKGTVKKGKAKASTVEFTPRESVYLGVRRSPSISLSDSHLPLSSRSTNVSRKNSVGRSSIMSAPGAPDRIRRASTISNAIPTSTSPHSVPGPSSSDKSKPKRSGHERKGSNGNGVVYGVSASGNQPSLMSIVEGVGRANREGWKTHRASQSQPHIPSTIEIPKAPARISRMELDTGMVLPSSMALPKAPGSVIRNQTIANGSASPKIHAPVATPKPVNPMHRNTIQVVSGSTSALGPPRPLKSALRSRTPSPNPQVIAAQQSPRSVNGHPSQSEVERLGRSGAAKSDVTLTTTRDLTQKENDSDEASVSSYETGHENVDEEEEASPPPPPPLNAPASDVSASTTSTQMAVKPARRKSVRISQQPTFSPTPPALDDDELPGPWGNNTEEPIWGKGTRRAVRDGERDMWEDSSEEDEEYQKARRLLSTARSKKKAKK